MVLSCKNCVHCKGVKGYTKTIYICLENSNIKAKKYAFVQGNAKPCEDYEIKKFAEKEGLEK